MISIKKRLRGRVVTSQYFIANSDHMDACINLVKQMEGKLHLCLEGLSPRNAEGSDRVEVLLELPQLTYVSQSSKFLMPSYISPSKNEIVFQYYYYKNTYVVYYRPALLNGRHIVDVLRAVCGPADVSEAELDQARKTATRKAKKDFNSVWGTTWNSPQITVRCNL